MVYGWNPLPAVFVNEKKAVNKMMSTREYMMR